MAIEIKPSDLYYKYPRKKEFREQPKFTGKPDPTPFDRDDQYEVIPMLQAVMDSIGTIDGAVLEKLEEMMIFQMPAFINAREEVFDYLVALARERFA